ncbi:MAG: hypothetical protein H3C43_10990, partial [Leptonema sp. (in: Bacteria)]|nr:hypothetical protein [Leptonema sp. (in: bacteria)]
SSCASVRNESPLNNQPTIVIDRLSIWTDPAIQNNGDIDSIANQMLNYRAFLTKNLFNDSSSIPIQVVLYKNQESYSKQQKTEIQSWAHYNITTKTVHVSIDAPSQVWQHEFIHAILNQKNLRYPFWIHEGMSLLFQSIQPTDLSFCKVDVRLPSELYRFRNHLLELHKPIPIPEQNRFGREDIFSDTVLSAYFAFFLYQRQQLIDLVRDFNNSNQSSFLLLLNGNYQDLKKLETEFYHWLATDQPLESSRNC